MTVAILAGGFGTRLAPVFPERQKTIAPVVGQPFLAYILSQLHKATFTHVIICISHLAHQIQETFDNQYKSLAIQYSQELSPLGTAGAIRYALPLFRSETILVINGDTFCDINFQQFLQFHKQKKAKTSIALSRVSDTTRFGTVSLENDDTIIGFQEKKSGRVGLVNAGMYLMQRDGIAQIPEGKIISIEHDVFPRLVGKGLYGYKTKRTFLDIGTPESFRQAQQFFADYKL